MTRSGTRWPQSEGRRGCWDTQGDVNVGRSGERRPGRGLEGMEGRQYRGLRWAGRWQCRPPRGWDGQRPKHRDEPGQLLMLARVLLCTADPPEPPTVLLSQVRCTCASWQRLALQDQAVICRAVSWWSKPGGVLVLRQG